MSIPGCDGAEQPSGAALAAAGLVFMARYLPYKLVDGSWNPKGLTAAQVADLRAHGIAIVPNWEQVSTRANQGYAAGVSDASTSSGALINLGFPAEQGVYFSVDFPTNGYTAAQWAPIDAYFDGVASVLRVARTWVYGGYDTIAHFVANGKASKFWQTRAWSGTPPKIHPKADIYQPAKTQVVGGVTVDLDTASVQDYGQWPAPGGDVIVSEHPKFEDWQPNGTNGVFRAKPVRSDPVIGRVAAGVMVRTECEVTTDDPLNSDWRRSRQLINGVLTTVYMLRSDWVPLVAGGDPKVDALGESYMARKLTITKYQSTTEMLAVATPTNVITQEA